MNYLKIKAKAGAFCIVELYWEYPERDPILITEVYTGPEEHGSSGPFFECNYRWELYDGYSDYKLLLWTYKTRSGTESRDYESIKIFHGKNYGREWSLVAEQSLQHLIGSRA